MRLVRIAATAMMFGIGLGVSAGALPVTPLSLTDGALTVHFVGTPAADAFVITNEILFDRLKGNTLIEVFASNNDLIVTFSEPVTFVSFDFALSTNTPGNIAFEATLGGALVSAGSGASAVPSGFVNAEGTLGVSNSGFDGLVLHSPDAQAFAIDNLWVTAGDTRHLFTFDTPEPLTLLLFGAGLVALSRRRKQSDR